MSALMMARPDNQLDQNLNFLLLYEEFMPKKAVVGDVTDLEDDVVENTKESKPAKGLEGVEFVKEDECDVGGTEGSCSGEVKPNRWWNWIRRRRGRDLN